MQGYYDGEYKQGELLDLSVFPDEVKNEVDDNWGEPVSMEHDFTIEEILNMSTEGEVQMNLTNMDCVGQNELCKVVSPKNSETPKQDIEFYKTGDCRESVYIETDNVSHGECNHKLFCVNGNDSDYIDIDDLY